MAPHNWIDLSQDADTGIETLRAHFEGHAYDPHWHDSYLMGVTEQGVQQFNCRRARHNSVPGQVFLVEPGEVHDGDAPTADGFTYHMLYLDPQWLAREVSAGGGMRRSTVNWASPAPWPTIHAWRCPPAKPSRHCSSGELRIVRQTGNGPLARTPHRPTPLAHPLPRRSAPAAGGPKGREYLHDHPHQDVGIDQLAPASGVDRFRLSRAFKGAFGLPPHAYLVQLRLSKRPTPARQGRATRDGGDGLGFADQSHLGRWFARAYGLTPAVYRKRCSNVPDS